MGASTTRGSRFVWFSGRVGLTSRASTTHRLILAVGSQTTASITWDAFNRARGIVAEGNTNFAYCYDAFGRRIAQWDAESADTLMGRRYIWDGWSTIQERIFSNYLQETEPESEEWIEMVPTEASAHSKAERVYVNGASIDEPLFVAIDGDLDGYIGEEDPSNFTSVNLPEFEKPEDTPQRVTGRHDFAYYYLNNRMGSITALLARNLEATEPLELSEEAHESARILEYYRYSAYGSVTVLPAHDDGAAKSLVDTGGGTGVYHASDDDMGSGSRKAWDRVEDTPLDLADNNSIMLLRREADGTYSHLSARADYGRVSQFGNTFTFTARRQDPHTGLMYYRYRMYEPVSGRFVGRDPLGYVDGGNAYQGLLNGVSWARDRFGRDVWTENSTAVGGWHRRVCVDVWDEECKKKTGKYCISFGLANGDGEGSSAGSSAEAPAEGNPGSGEVYADNVDEATKEICRCPTNCETDKKILAHLKDQRGKTGTYNAFFNNCRHYSDNCLEEVKKEHGLKTTDEIAKEKAERERKEREDNAKSRQRKATPEQENEADRYRRQGGSHGPKIDPLG